ncbi:MAG: hypothetical protein HY049_11800 [Acidobacteria bacterium]|nr:hypothetical protein [Acidobacteriota bacterium]
MIDRTKDAAARLAAEALDEAERAGAAAADVYVKESISRETSLPSGALGRSAERGIALRWFGADGRSALAAATLRVGDDEPSVGASPSALARRAADTAAGSAPGARTLPSPWVADGRGLGLFDPDLDGSPESLLAVAEQMRNHALEAAAGCEAEIRLVATISTVLLVNSSGFSGSFRQSMARLDLTMSAGPDRRHVSARVVRAARSLRGLAADSAIVEAIGLMEEAESPKLPPAGIHEVVLGPRAAAEIVAAVAPWVTQGVAAGAEGSRRAAPSRGERIGGQALTMLDDGRIPGGVASAPFDGEGCRTQRTVVIERGVVRELLRDLTGGEGGEGSTGNGVRASFRESPELKTSNFFIKPGAGSPAELIASLKQGIRITTLGRLPRLSGPESAFAVPFTGRWIEGGRLGAPLAGGYLAGTAREILGEIEAAGTDLTFFQRGGSFGAPSLLLRRAPIRSS